MALMRVIHSRPIVLAEMALSQAQNTQPASFETGFFLFLKPIFET